MSRSRLHEYMNNLYEAGLSAEDVVTAGHEFAYEMVQEENADAYQECVADSNEHEQAAQMLRETSLEMGLNYIRNIERATEFDEMQQQRGIA